MKLVAVTYNAIYA